MEASLAAEAAGGGVHAVVGVAEGEMVDAVGEVGGLDVEALRG